MSTTTVPAPTFGFLYPSMTLTGVSSSSSCWEVLNAFLASADGAFGRLGVVLVREILRSLLIRKQDGDVVVREPCAL